MTDFDVKEIRFEQDLEEHLLVNGGFQKGDPKSIDRKLALDMGLFFNFLKNSQPQKWKRYEKSYGKIVKSKLLMILPRGKNGGLLRVFRQGFTDPVLSFKLYSGSSKHLLMLLVRNNMKKMFYTVQ